jgi:phosphatidylserine decarboxylase
VLERRDRVLATNERAVLRLATARGPLFLVMVGALNVGRIRIVGVPEGSAFPGRKFARGDELARFELGSTVVLIAPPGGPRPVGPAAGAAVRMGEAIGRWNGP